MSNKRIQRVTVWLLPLVVIGGIFWPVLGYLVIAMMAIFLVLSYFQARYWCWNICPRGAFLDIVMPRMTLNRRIPAVFVKPWFRWSVFVALMAFLVFRLIGAGASLLAVGAVFVTMCIVTTLIAIILGVSTKPRAWCVICPMGNLQEQISKSRKK
jgi:ferredoxin-type protein NapH